MTVSYQKDQDGKLEERVEVVATTVNAYSREDVERLLDSAKECLEIKELEVVGAQKEVARFEAMLAKCEELEVINPEAELEAPAEEGVDAELEPA